MGETIDFPGGRRFFYLEGISEPQDNMLRLEIIEANAQGPNIALPGIAMEGRVITPEPEARALEIVWDWYVAYCVRNESFARSEDLNEVPTDMLVERPRSAFLDFLAKATFASPEYPGTLKHWELICLNHVIDVVATTNPVIKVLDR